MWQCNLSFWKNTSWLERWKSDEKLTAVEQMWLLSVGKFSKIIILRFTKHILEFLFNSPVRKKLSSVKSPGLISFVSVHFGIIFSKLGLNPNQTDFENSRVLGNLILAF